MSTDVNVPPEPTSLQTSERITRCYYLSCDSSMIYCEELLGKFVCLSPSPIVSAVIDGTWYHLVPSGRTIKRLEIEDGSQSTNLKLLIRRLNSEHEGMPILWGNEEVRFSSGEPLNAAARTMAAALSSLPATFLADVDPADAMLQRPTAGAEKLRDLGAALLDWEARQHSSFRWPESATVLGWTPGHAFETQSDVSVLGHDARAGELSSNEQLKLVTLNCESVPEIQGPVFVDTGTGRDEVDLHDQTKLNCTMAYSAHKRGAPTVFFKARSSLPDEGTLALAGSVLRLASTTPGSSELHVRLTAALDGSYSPEANHALIAEKDAIFMLPGKTVLEVTDDVRIQMVQRLQPGNLQAYQVLPTDVHDLWASFCEQRDTNPGFIQPSIPLKEGYRLFLSSNDLHFVECFNHCLGNETDRAAYAFSRDFNASAWMDYLKSMAHRQDPVKKRTKDPSSVILSPTEASLVDRRLLHLMSMTKLPPDWDDRDNWYVDGAFYGLAEDWTSVRSFLEQDGHRAVNVPWPLDYALPKNNHVAILLSSTWYRAIGCYLHSLRAVGSVPHGWELCELLCNAHHCSTSEWSRLLLSNFECILPKHRNITTRPRSDKAKHVIISQLKNFQAQLDVLASDRLDYAEIFQGILEQIGRSLTTRNSKGKGSKGKSTSSVSSSFSGRGGITNYSQAPTRNSTANNARAPTRNNAAQVIVTQAYAAALEGLHPTPNQNLVPIDSVPPDTAPKNEPSKQKKKRGGRQGTKAKGPPQLPTSTKRGPPPET